MLDLLDRELTRSEDRALFGLPEKPPLQSEPSGIVGQAGSIRPERFV